MNKINEPVQGQPGEHIKTFATKLVEQRHSVLMGGRDFEAEFNGAIITIKQDSTAESIVEDFMSVMNKNAEAYRNSDEYKQQQIKQSNEADKRVAEWNVLMEKLNTLKHKDHNVVLDWLYNYCETIDFIPALEKEPKMVESRMKVADTLINVFGYEPNVNTGDKFKKDNEENFARYLIGQVLVFLSKNSPVPQAFGSMYEGYKEQFKITIS